MKKKVLTAFVVVHKIAEMEGGRENGMLLDLDNPVHWNDLSAARIRDARTFGVIVNKDQARWVAFKRSTDRIWLLDSVADGPIEYTFEEYQDFLKEFKDAFCLQSTS